MIGQAILKRSIKVEKVNTISYAHESTVNNLIAYKVTVIK